MADISQHIAPKSDQLNSDDLAAGDRTIRIREVKVLGAGEQQPIWIYFDGDNGKPWKPCKTMARLLANLWQAPDTSTWAGRSVTIYRDPEVMWGGAKIGGIRVRAVSHIDAPRQVAISESKTKRKLATIQNIKADVRPIQQGAEEDGATKWARAYIAAVNDAEDRVALESLANQRAKKLAELEEKRPDLHRQCVEALDKCRADFAREGKPETEMGEGFDDADDQPGF